MAYGQDGYGHQDSTPAYQNGQGWPPTAHAPNDRRWCEEPSMQTRPNYGQQGSMNGGGAWHMPGGRVPTSYGQGVGAYGAIRDSDHRPVQGRHDHADYGPAGRRWEPSEAHQAVNPYHREPYLAGVHPQRGDRPPDVRQDPGHGRDYRSRGDDPSGRGDPRRPQDEVRVGPSWPVQPTLSQCQIRSGSS